MAKDPREELDCEKLHHPTFSPGLSPSDYISFKNLPNHLDDLRSTSRKEFGHELVSYFASEAKYTTVRKFEETIGTFLN